MVPAVACRVTVSARLDTGRTVTDTEGRAGARWNGGLFARPASSGRIDGEHYGLIVSWPVHRHRPRRTTASDRGFGSPDVGGGITSTDLLGRLGWGDPDLRQRGEQQLATSARCRARQAAPGRGGRLVCRLHAAGNDWRRRRVLSQGWDTGLDLRRLKDRSGQTGASGGRLAACWRHGYVEQRR